MGGCSSLTSLFIEDFMLQHREVEKQGRSRLHERKHRIFTLYLLDFVICHVFIGRSVSLSAHTGVPWPGPCVVAYWRGVWLLEHSVCVGPLHGPANIVWAGLGLAVTAAIDTWHHQVQTQSRISVHTCPAVCACGGQLRRGHGVSHPGETRVLPGVGLGGHHAVERWSSVTCHVSRVTSHVCRAVGRLRSLRGLGRGSVRRHAGGGAAAALRHAHSALSLRSPGTQPRYYILHL